MSASKQNNNDESKSFLSGKYHPWRRFFARSIDLSTIGLLLIFILSFMLDYLLPEYSDKYFAVLENEIMAGIYLFAIWIPVEAIFITSIGTTPGKWLFGIKVLKTDGKKLSFSNALKRTMLVWVQGTGIGIPIVAFFTQLFAYNRLTKTGTTLWDKSVNSNVVHEEWGILRYIFCIISILFMFFIIVIISSENQ